MNKLLIIIPVYNKEEFLEGAIQSILQQSYDNYEVVIVDDCSTDKSINIINQYKDNPKITILQNETNQGCYRTRNRALEYAKDKEWDYFTIHDADDVSDINRVKILIERLESDRSIVAMKTGFIRMHYDTKEVDYLNGEPHIGCSEGIAVYSRKMFNEIGYFDDTRFSGDSDYLWRCMAWCSIIDNQYKVIEHKAPLYIAYLHENNLTKIYNWETDRPNYWKKSQQDIQQMAKVKNFYRKFI